MPKQNYFEKGQLTDVAYLVLLTLVKPKHGYSIMQEVSSMTNGEGNIGPASLYTTLKKLTEAELIELIDSGNNKKTYKITEEGLSALVVEIDKRKRLADYGIKALERYRKERT